MKTFLRKHSKFAGLSLLWSLLLYVTAILIIDWDEFRNGYKNGVQVVHISPQQTPGGVKHIARNSHVLKAIWLHLVRSSHI